MGQVFTDPIFYMITVAVIYLYKREVDKIQKLDNIREYVVTSIIHTLCGLGIGLFVSGTLSYFGMISVLEIKVLVLIPIALFLMTINPRFGCFSYCITCAYILECICKVLGLRTLMLPYMQLVLLVGILHIIEGFLVMLVGHTKAIPLPTYEKGRLIVSYILRHMWLVPIMIVTKESSLFVPLYTLLAYGDYVKKGSIKKQTYKTGALLLIYGSILVAMGYLSRRHYLPIGGIIILMPVLHEMIFLFSHKELLIAKKEV